MTDQLITGLLEDAGLRVLVATTSELSRHARRVHTAHAGAPEVMADALTAAALLAGLQLQKGPSRVNLQLECDGPLRGLFADAGTDGTLRGYVKNPLVELQGNRNAFRYRPLLGNSGFLSVLRDQGGGEFYRSSIQLEALDLSLDLERFFLSSEQLPAAVMLDVAPGGDEPLGHVAGVLLQPLPDGDREVMAQERARLRDGGDFQRTLERVGATDARALAKALFPQAAYEEKGLLPLVWRCTCSRERVLDTIQSTGRAEIEDMLATDGQAEVTCTFCSAVYQVSGDELRSLISPAQA